MAWQGPRGGGGPATNILWGVMDGHGPHGTVDYPTWSTPWSTKSSFAFNRCKTIMLTQWIQTISYYIHTCITGHLVSAHIRAQLPASVASHMQGGKTPQHAMHQGALCAPMCGDQSTWLAHWPVPQHMFATAFVEVDASARTAVDCYYSGSTTVLSMLCDTTLHTSWVGDSKVSCATLLPNTANTGMTGCTNPGSAGVQAQRVGSHTSHCVDR